CDAHRAVSLGADGLGGTVFHGDALVGVHDLYRKPAVVIIVIELATDEGFLADQNHFDAQSSGGLDCPFDFGFWGRVPAHCVYGHGQHSREVYYCSATSTTSRPLYCPQ